MPDFDPPLPLRAIANSIVSMGMAKKGDKYGFYCLLGLLKSGQIQAVASFVDIANVPLRIPQAYWTMLGPDALNPLIKNSRKGWYETYKIRLKDLTIEAYRSASARNDAERSQEQLVAELMKQANKTSCVEVLQSEWQRFAGARERAASDDEETRGPGRPEKNWEAVYKELAAVLWLAIDRTNPKLVNRRSLPAELAASLQAMGIDEVPAISTIENGMAAVRTRVGQLRKASANRE
ncbi:hypothetical protein [Microvirga aerophila]|uniref:Uncharacterized protein n=1 Tax=Microvirga aerophila TaxID=670291 RepID=A0A512C210_9HYPH|nr:hypothetical protein [Microvirga aerophila]GEO18067.1 hypothetical protein MAE02_57630 [Microvirga aerophila]